MVKNTSQGKSLGHTNSHQCPRGRDDIAQGSRPKKTKQCKSKRKSTCMYKPTHRPTTRTLKKSLKSTKLLSSLHGYPGSTAARLPLTFCRLRTSMSLSCFLKADSSSSCNEEVKQYGTRGNKRAPCFKGGPMMDPKNGKVAIRNAATPPLYLLLAFACASPPSRSNVVTGSSTTESCFHISVACDMLQN